ncbi:MAG: alpha amylase C-terminal domain-containing protein [Marinilabiliaceae bacterium]|jgi:1,4-alpha-glucan branching enzyme|nr:alpha amylase C-terminal domain-containing protein [Marinilabiliaceae bacterium]
MNGSSNIIPGPFYLKDKWLDKWIPSIDERHKYFLSKKEMLVKGGKLADFAAGHLYYGTQSSGDSIILREWAPDAIEMYLVGTFNKWTESAAYSFKKINDNGDWELKLSHDHLPEGSLYKLSVKWAGGSGLRIPAYARRLIQDDKTKIFSAQYAPSLCNYRWKNTGFIPGTESPLIYEAHIGMSSEEEKVSTFEEFRKEVLPRIVDAGYNTLQLMAIQEHPYYGSFGYHVSNFFAVSSRFGTPGELKALIDDAHAYGINVIMDLVHSHSVKNTEEGLALFAGKQGQYFHTGARGTHSAWDSLCFDYGKDNVIHFLLSNCRYWIEEYQFDGFRFDGVTSMLYYDHGLSRDFVDYSMYFDGNQDPDAINYLKLANSLIHELKPGAITIAEEMSGMPGTSATLDEYGLGFDYRLNMGAPDFWIKIIKEKRDEDWDVDKLFFEMSRHRAEEQTITYCESHDQALVGDKTLMFRLADAAMYNEMITGTDSLIIDRAIALHKMIRLFTLSTGQSGYLNFMGNEFGHPEWIDFPREGNNWSFKYARRQWSLADNQGLRYRMLNLFDRAMIQMVRDENLFGTGQPEKIYSSVNDCIIAFSRAGLLFIFNFHPHNSYTGYRIPVSGRFRIILNSDKSEFGGQDRIDTGILYLSQRPEGSHLNTPPDLPLYLPARTALVFKNEPLRKINQST